MRRKHHLRVKRMGRTPSLTGLELSILLYLHGDFERSDEEIIAECRGIEQESVRHASVVWPGKSSSSAQRKKNSFFVPTAG